MQAADVSSFLALSGDKLSTDPVTALRAIFALGQLAVQQASANFFPLPEGGCCYLSSTETCPMGPFVILQAKKQPTDAGRLLFQPKVSGVLQGSDFTTFFMAALSEPGVQGMRLAPGEYSVFVPAGTDAHIRLPCDPNKPRQAPFVVDLSGSTLIFQVSEHLVNPFLHCCKSAAVPVQTDFI